MEEIKQWSPLLLVDRVGRILELTDKEPRDPSGMLEMFHILIRIWIILVYAFLNINISVYIIHITVHKQCLILSIFI